MQVVEVGDGGGAPAGAARRFSWRVRSLGEPSLKILAPVAKVLSDFVTARPGACGAPLPQRAERKTEICGDILRGHKGVERGACCAVCVHTHGLTIPFDIVRSKVRKLHHA
jgi:hypothetical protein